MDSILPTESGLSTHTWASSLHQPLPREPRRLFMATTSGHRPGRDLRGRGNHWPLREHRYLPYQELARFIYNLLSCRGKEATNYKKLNALKASTLPCFILQQDSAFKIPALFVLSGKYETERRKGRGEEGKEGGRTKGMRRKQRNTPLTLAAEVPMRQTRVKKPRRTSFVLSAIQNEGHVQFSA